MKKIIISSIVLFSLYTIKQRRNDTPRIFYLPKMPFGLNGMVIPPFGIFIRADLSDNEELLLHELVHWQQFQREGLVQFLLNYAQENARNGYDGNKYEIEARYRESDFCQSNYTYCVRNGLAKTVYNPNFRQGRA